MKNKILSYFRTITVHLPILHEYRKKVFVLMDGMNLNVGRFLLLYLGMLAVVLSIGLYLSYYVYEAKVSKYRIYSERLLYWENVIYEHPDYPDAFYNASYFAASTHDLNRALQYVESAIYLDQDFEKAKELKEEILKSNL